MEIKDVGMAGTLESSDIMISIEKNEGKGIEIELKSTVESQFGSQIRKVIKETLEKMGVTNVFVRANDKGALDCTIQARVEAAASRATQAGFKPWEVE
ncbi:MAG: citrate lyase acyl carrier protein [Desulfitobacteriaceae bacterium]|nr:citrate lyase acyl carrier protein [Desulfitobacteriaceae bacterium]MDD4753219.1 citrate lyase acyl carrier protein [Desulfitobacteriaceae bacterium]